MAFKLLLFFVLCWLSFCLKTVYAPPPPTEALLVGRELGYRTFDDDDRRLPNIELRHENEFVTVRLPVKYIQTLLRTTDPMGLTDGIFSRRLGSSCPDLLLPYLSEHMRASLDTPLSQIDQLEIVVNRALIEDRVALLAAQRRRLISTLHILIVTISSSILS